MRTLSTIIKVIEDAKNAMAFVVASLGVNVESILGRISALSLDLAV